KNAALSNKNSSDSSDSDVEINRSGVSLGGERVHKESDHTLIEELQNEIKSLKDDNQSMNQYIQKMLNRIMEVDGFEETLATNWTPELHQKKLSKVNDRVSNPTSPNTSNDSLNKPLPSKPRNNSFSSDFKFPTSSSANSSSSSPTSTTSKFSLTPLTTSLTTSLINSLSSPVSKDEIIDDKEDSTVSTTRKLRASDDYSTISQRPSTNVPRRSQTMTNGSNKRFSILKWGSYAFGTNAAALAAAKKEDPRMKPILLVEKNRD
ncbi:26786_t:CDS:2, partial [Racocetra persica]